MVFDAKFFLDRQTSTQKDRGTATMFNRSISGLAGIAFLALVLLPAILLAEETTCRGKLGTVTVDNLRVPDGARCTLDRTRVKGTIKVESGASLDARGVRVVGNVQAENARRVSVSQSSRVGGSVQIKQGGSASVLNSHVEGDIQYDANRSSLSANDSRVGGNVQIIGNNGRAEIYRNTIDGNLQCKENSPRPVGGGNKVGGNKEDQCSAF
jgi:hypothetical protein